MKSNRAYCGPKCRERSRTNRRIITCELIAGDTGLWMRARRYFQILRKRRRTKRNIGQCMANGCNALARSRRDYP